MKKTNLDVIHLITTLVFIAVTVTLRTLACLGDMNYRTGYFSDKLLINVANCIAAAACVISLLFCFFGKNKKKYRLNMHSPLIYVPAGTVSVALIFFAASSIHTLVKLPGAFFSTETFSSTENILLALVSVLALVSLAYFMIESIFDKQKSAERGAAGLVMVLFLTLLAAYTYFSKNMPINSHVKITDQLAYIFAAVFFLYECRMALDRDRWSAYVAVGGIAAILTAYSSIPALVVYAAKGEVISSSISENVLGLGICLLIVARLILLILSPEDKKSETADAIALMSSARRAEIEASAIARARALEIIKEETEIKEEPEIENVLDDNYKMDIDNINITDIIGEE